MSPPRWENTVALGPQRNHLLGTIAVADLLFFFMRQPVADPSAMGCDLIRLQKRLLHLCAQRVEMAFGDGSIRLTSVATALKTGDTMDLQQWSASKTRTQSADLLRQELIRRFMAKPNGFVTGFKNSEQSELKMLPGAKNHGCGVQAASQFVTAYFALASEMCMTKLSRQRFKHIAFFFDAATLGKWNEASINVYEKMLEVFFCPSHVFT